MTARPELMPCLLCGSKVTYLWNEAQVPESSNLNNASNATISASYGSKFDTDDYEATVCDECLARAIEMNRVRFFERQ